MASMLENVLGYLRPKNSSTSDTTDENAAPAEVVGGENYNDFPSETDEDAEWVYDIEDQDDWQIVRKMDDDVDCPDGKELEDGDAEQAELDDEVSGMEDMENWFGGRTNAAAATATNRCHWQMKSWYLAPPPCFTRSAPSPSTNPLENLLIEHPSMSVYLLPLAASTARQAMLCRSAPAAVMERTLAGQLPIVPDTVGVPDATDRETTPPGNRFGNDEGVAVVPRRPISHKRKRRLRQQLERTENNHPPNVNNHVPAQRAELGTIRVAAAEADKINQNEDRQRRIAKTNLAKHQLQRMNLLTEHNVPKRTGNRDGKRHYRCLH